MLVEHDGQREVIVKGAPETVLARCTSVAPGAPAVLDREFAAGSRVIAVAARAAPESTALTAADERDLDLVGFLTFIDRPKVDAGAALERLRRLDVQVKIITGDNERVAQKVCADIGLAVDQTLTGSQLDQLDEAQLAPRWPPRRSSRA